MESPITPPCTPQGEIYDSVSHPFIPLCLFEKKIKGKKMSRKKVFKQAKKKELCVPMSKMNVLFALLYSQNDKDEKRI